MNAALFIGILATLACHQVQAKVQRDVLTQINVFRHLHAVGPLLVDDVIQKNAQNAAAIFQKTKNKNSVPIYKYSANFCTYVGSESNLPRTCVVSWYVSMKYYVWCKPKAQGQALPFVNMIWKASTKAGVGVVRGKAGTYFVVVYIAVEDGNNIVGNVPPVKVVMEASPKAKCPSGYSRFGTSCFKYEKTAVTWDQAVMHCAKENATLASIRNAKEEEFVRGLQRNTGLGLETWIGLHDSLYEGRFKWIDGLKFQKGVCVPVHADGGTLENCVAWTISKPKGCWDDRRCADKIPYTCRLPVEGKSTYRTEILLKKFRWRPSYKDKNSKAYRDLMNGIKITFKEIFTRMSGKKKGGFRKVNVKGIRPVAFKGRSAGLGLTLSIKFRSFTPDPTVRFQKFLRDSEKIISMAVDKPDKVAGKTGKAGNYCYGACKHRRCAAKQTAPNLGTICPSHCHTIHHMGPCPPSCPTSCCTSLSQPNQGSICPSHCNTTHPMAPCPPSCPTSCCTSFPQQPPSYMSNYYPAPGYPAPAPPEYYSPSYPGDFQTATNTYDPYPSTCPSTCSQYPTLDCFMHCNDECCESRDGKRKWSPKALRIIKKMRKNFRKLKHLMKEEKNHRDIVNITSIGLEELGGKDSDSKDDEESDSKDDEEDEEEANNVIKAMKTNIRNLEIGLEKESKVNEHQTDEMNISFEPTSYFNSTTDKTEPTSHGDEDENEARKNDTSIDDISDQDEQGALDVTNFGSRNVSNLRESDHGDKIDDDDDDEGNVDHTNELLPIQSEYDRADGKMKSNRTADIGSGGIDEVLVNDSINYNPKNVSKLMDSNLQDKIEDAHEDTKNDTNEKLPNQSEHDITDGRRKSNRTRDMRPGAKNASLDAPLFQLNNVSNATTGLDNNGHGDIMDNDKNIDLTSKESLIQIEHDTSDEESNPSHTADIENDENNDEGKETSDNNTGLDSNEGNSTVTLDLQDLEDDATDEMLDQEGIGDSGHTGKKRNKVTSKKKTKKTSH